jgi:predicted RNA-binding Zn-ribbon protein involved in translation (DUF1610 family)
VTELELFKQALREGTKNKMTWIIKYSDGHIEARCPECFQKPHEDENGNPIITKICPHCGEVLIH